jgi:CBS domain-containing protein
MTATVKEIMNAELYALGPADTAMAARDGLLAMGVSSAPVLDLGGRPVGQVSLRHLLRARDRELAFEYMTVPACTLHESAPIGDAARLLAHADHTHIVVVDAADHALGAVSAVDVLRAIIGRPVHHPSAFPHFDEEAEVVWTDDQPWEEAALRGAPAAPGVFALVVDAPGVARRVVWVEEVADLQARLVETLYVPQEDVELAQWLAYRALQFRVALVGDPTQRLRIVETIRARIREDVPGARGTRGDGRDRIGA